MPDKAEYRVDEKPLGRGFGNTCLHIEGSEDVLMLEHAVGRLFQTNKPEFIARCIDALGRRGVKVAEGIEILQSISVLRHGVLREVECAVREPFIEGYDEKLLKLELTRELLNEIVKMVNIGYELRTEEQLGLDPMGAGLVMDVFKGAPQAVILYLSKILPSGLRRIFERAVPGIEGKARNFIRNEDGELQYTDILMHDFSENGKLRRLMEHYNSFTFAGLVELARYINERLPEEERLNPEIIDNLPVLANSFHRVVAKALFKMMTPLFEHFKLNKGHLREFHMNIPIR